MGYRNLRHYVGGMADWTEAGAVIDRMDAPALAVPVKSLGRLGTSRQLSWLEKFVNLSLSKLVGIWLGTILVFGLIYWLAGIGMGWGLQAGNSAVKTDWGDLWTAIYFSFVTALDRLAMSFQPRAANLRDCRGRGGFDDLRLCDFKAAFAPSRGVDRRDSPHDV
jgi:hypothetical protein